MTALLVTRPEPEAGRTTARLAGLGVPALAAPMLTARALGHPPPPPGDFAALALTSANAVRFLVGHPGWEGASDLPVYAVGDRTAEMARASGFARVESASGDLTALAALLRRARPEGTVLHAAGKHPSGDLAALLEEDGIAVRTHAVYEMEPAETFPAPALARLEAGTIGGALLYSRRTALVFAALLPERFRKGLACLCISPACAGPLTGFGRLEIAAAPTGAAMESLALAFARGQIKA